MGFLPGGPTTGRTGGHIMAFLPFVCVMPNFLVCFFLQNASALGQAGLMSVLLLSRGEKLTRHLKLFEIICSLVAQNP